MIPASASQWLPRFPVPLSLPWLSTAVPPGFPCFPSIFSTWLFCRFPFVPPSSAPAAASLVLTFLRFLSSPSFRHFPFPFAFFRPLRFPSDYSALCPFFSPLPAFPWPWFLRRAASALASRLPPSVTPVSMRSFRFWYSALCSSFLPLPFRLADGYFARSGLPFGLAVSPWLSL